MRYLFYRYLLYRYLLYLFYCYPVAVGLLLIVFGVFIIQGDIRGSTALARFAGGVVVTATVGETWEETDRWVLPSYKMRASWHDADRRIVTGETAITRQEYRRLTAGDTIKLRVARDVPNEATIWVTMAEGLWSIGGIYLTGITLFGVAWVVAGIMTIIYRQTIRKHYKMRYG